MGSIYIAVVSITIALNAVMAAAGFARAKFVLANSAQVDVPPSWLPMLAALKAAGVIGLVLGFLGVRAIGIAAAAGLVLFFIGAVTAHIRARVFYNIAFPGTYLLLTCASLALAITH